MAFTLDEVRRLTGPNLLSNYPGAIADVLFTEVPPDEVLRLWQVHIGNCMKALNWENLDYEAPQWRDHLQIFTRVYEGGASLSIAAPMDLLYSACDLVELAWDLCVEQLIASSSNQNEAIGQDARLKALSKSIDQERNPALLRLLTLAQQHDVLCLVDDDELSLGSGASSSVWPIDSLPEPSTINWQAYSEVALSLITGTNGKSTSVRLAAQIAKAAGICAGVTSTDFIKVGDTIIDDGDYSGPGGARMLLRDKRCEMAFLEVARGGLLRRGLPVSRANAALVTNIASDHLGQYGINTVDEITDVKMMVAKAVAPRACLQASSNNTSRMQATLVLNADDKRLVQSASVIDAPICWFSLDANNPMITQARKLQRPCVFVEYDEIVYSEQRQTSIARVNDIPMTMQGTAQHNVQNALGVIGLCVSLDIPRSAIRAGLHSFASSANDNPGRGNVYELNGIKVIVDFAHNSHSMQAVINMAANMQAERTHVMFSHAGDRSDQDIKDLSDSVHQLSPTTYCLAELTQYLRGREVGEISTLVRQHLLSKGVAQAQILLADDPLSGTKMLMSKAQKGDLVLLFVLSDRESVQRFLTQ